MRQMTRRSFLRASASAAAATAATPILSRGWFSLPGMETPGYFEREFGITDGLCRKALAEALAKGGDYADLFFEHTISNWLQLEDGKVNRAYSEIALGVGIRTVKGDQVGYGFTQELSEKSILMAAATAATIADSLARSPSAKLSWLGLKDYYPLKSLFTSVPVESKLPLVQSANDRCFALSPLIVKVNAGFHDQQKRILIVTSDGTKTEDLQPHSFLYAGVVAEKNGRREQAGWNRGAAGISHSSQTRSSRISPKHRSKTPSSFSARSSRRPERCLSSWARESRESCSTRRSATGWKPTSTGRSNPPTQP